MKIESTTCRVYTRKFVSLRHDWPILVYYDEWIIIHCVCNASHDCDVDSITLVPVRFSSIHLLQILIRLFSSKQSSQIFTEAILQIHIYTENNLHNYKRGEIPSSVRKGEYILCFSFSVFISFFQFHALSLM